jgi:glycosyltransferase involved in cell wall biosynthesis
VTLPFVSCLCPTYGRYPERGWLLGEAVESFLRQEYPGDRRELVLLNDAPSQVLTCDAPGVRVVNAPARYASLGEKRNALAELARGQVLLPWDDDDISLGGRISQAMGKLFVTPYPGPSSFGYWKPPQVWFLPGGGPPLWRHAVGYRHHASAYTREAWAAAGGTFRRPSGEVVTWRGGYPPTSGDEDALIDAALVALGRTAPEPDAYSPGSMPPGGWQYVYRWGCSDRHLSSRRDLDAHYREIGERPVVAGTFTIRPHWRRDYSAWVAHTLAGR